MSVSAREANVYACIVDTVVAPGGDMPPLAHADPPGDWERLLAAAPAANRLGLRALMYAVDAGPLALGFGARMRRLGRDARLAYLDRLDRTPAAPLVSALEVLAEFAYYGDDGVMAALGYDPDAVVERGRRLRREEARW
jgi:hypothetical protein